MLQNTMAYISANRSKDTSNSDDVQLTDRQPAFVNNGIKDYNCASLHFSTAETQHGLWMQPAAA